MTDTVLDFGPRFYESDTFYLLSLGTFTCRVLEEDRT